MNTTPTQHQVRLAAQLYEMRDTARRLLGAKFKAQMATYGDVVKKVAAQHKESEVLAAMRIAKHPECTPTETVMVMAALVEMTEPSA